MRIYLDMDGVLCDFANSVLDRMNFYSEQSNIWDYMEMNVVEAMEKAILKTNRNTFVLNDIIPGIGSKETMNYMYRTIDGDVDFWADLPWLEEGKKLWEYLKDYKDLYILTSPHDNASIYGKKAWIQKNLGIPANKIIFERHKQKYANKNCVLIDDMAKNVFKFINDDGEGIIHKTADKTIKSLQLILQ